MTVRYITVTPITKLFKPATRAFGDIAIVGAAQNDDIKLTTTDVTALTQKTVALPISPASILKVLQRGRLSLVVVKHKDPKRTRYPSPIQIL